MRKVLIGLISFGLVLLGFWGFVQWMDTTPIQVPRAADSQEMAMPAAGADPQPLGDTTLEIVGPTRYFKYDPETKDIVAEYGFEMLLNPGEGSSRWRVEKPYLIFYQSDYHCRIDSERGMFQVERSGSQNVPKDAQLDENVVIHIMPNSGSRMAETTIHMDDVTFSSERSEFATDGPVTIESSQLQLEGYGLVLIFNTGLGKVEFLQIKDLDFLRVSDFASPGTPARSKAAKTSNKETAMPPQQTAQPSNQDTVFPPDQAVSASPPEAVSPSALYQCAIRDNVVIQYGSELIVSGADQVDILNIRFSDTADADAPEGGSSGRASAPPSGRKDKPAAEMPGQPAVQEDVSQNVIVRCDGGMIIQPMLPLGAVSEPPSDAALSFEMSGAPLKIDRLCEGSGNDFETLAHCGVLYYKPIEDVLRLFTNQRQPQILLNTHQSGSRIETRGNVAWDRKAQRANIGGPGRVYIGNTSDPAAPPSEIAFNGGMDLLFAQMPDDISSATIRTINFTGGMDAVLRQNGTLKTLADTAVFEFGGENQLAQARLDGDVYFESFEKGISSSKAEAQSAVFHFDNNQIAAADLKGAVHFASDSGQMDSSNARIEFGPDANGSMQPKTIRTDGDSVLQTLSDPEQPPAKFEAKKIEYDMLTGTGQAHGPIRFTFYQPADPNVTPTDGWIPVTITAEENAQFLADADGTVNQVIFNKNVVATRIAKTTLFTQMDEFHGDKLIVNVGKDAAGVTAISGITFTEGKVFGQSKKMRDEEILSNVRLDCTQMTFDQTTGIVLATGPGEIQLDNSKAAVTNSNGVGINFQRPSYALINGFDTIQWNLETRQITADGDAKTMQFAYVPLVDGQPEKYIYVSSQKLTASYQTDAAGKPMIQRISTDKGIAYIEMDKDKEKILRSLIGQTLIYDAVNDVGWLTITGSEAMPAMVNNARVPVIRYNVNTGQLQTELSTVPGVMNLPTIDKDGENGSGSSRKN